MCIGGSMKKYTQKEFTAFIGIDWADAKHDICLQSQGSDIREFSVLSHNMVKIDEWAQALYKRFGSPIAVAVELSKGPIIYALQKYDVFIIFPINPSTLATYRSAINPSGAKDDPTDAQFALDLMLRYPTKFKQLRPQSVEIRKLMFLVEQRRKFIDDKRRFANRLINTLKQYFPQMLEWFTHRDSLLFCNFILRWPTLQKLKRAHESTVINFFHANNARKVDLINLRIAGIKSSIPLTEDIAVISAHQLQAIGNAKQMIETIKIIKTFDEEIDNTFHLLADAELFSDLPGAGPQLAPRLLVAFGEERDRYSSASEVQQTAGIAPVTERSGQKCWVHWRWQCSKFLRQTFIEWAAKTIDKSYWAGIYYQKMRAKGNSHQAAIRALAYKWIRILYSCWKHKKHYNEVTYLNSLKKRNSPLLQDK